MKKNILALIMAFAMIFTLAIPAFAATSYTIFVEDVPNGTVTASESKAAAGTEVILTVKPDTGYAFDGFAEASSLGITEGSQPNTYKFTMPEGVAAITPSFVAEKYTISVPGVANGSVTFSKTSNILYDEEITYEVNPADGYELSVLKYTTAENSNGVNLSGGKFDMPASDIQIVAEFGVIKYDVKLSQTTGGTITCDTDEVAAGQKVYIDVTANAKYQVDSATITATGADEHPGYSFNSEKTMLSFTMPEADVTVKVNFSKIPGTEREIEIDGEIAHGEIDTNVDTAEEGDTVKIYVDPDTRYLLEDLSVTAGNTVIDIEDGFEGYYQFTMPDADVYITADFYRPTDGTYDITVDSDDGDAVIAVTGAKSGLTLLYSLDDRYYDVATKGDVVYVYVDPDPGYVVDEHDVKGASAVFPYDEETDSFYFRMPAADVEVVLTYEEDDNYEGDGDYKITTSYKTSRGEVEVDRYADEGDKVYFYVYADDDYEIDDILVYEDTTRETVVTHKKVTSSKYSFTMPDEDVVIMVTFIASDDDDDDDDDGNYDIFVIDSKDGDIKTNKSSANKGDIVKITIDPDSGYDVDEVIVTRYDDDKVVTVTKKSTYWQFTMPADDVIVEVTFVDEDDADEDEGEYEIDLYCDSGYADIDIPDRSDASKTVKIYIDLYDGCTVDEITVTRTNGKTVTVKKSSGYYYFTMPTSDVEVEITFDGDPVEEDDDDTTATGDYKINLSYDSIFGDVTTDSKAEAGEKVYVKFDLEHEVEVDTVKVISASTGEEITAKKSSDTKYYFTMPEDDVYVVCLFDSEEYDGETKYYVDLNIYDDVMGDASVSLSKAAKTERVYLFVDEDSEYAVGDIIVSRDNGRVITTTKVCDFVYYFAMPAGDVDVSVYFDEDQELRDYKVTLTYDKKMGEVLLSDETADAEDDVYVYVETYKGYELVSVKAKRTSNGKSVTVKTTRAGDYYFEMPEANVTVTVTFKKIEEEKPVDPKPVDPKPSEPAIHICPAKPYTDVDTNLWYHDAIDYVVSYNLMTGYSATLFAPNDNVSRAMIVTVLWRIAGQPATTTALPYTDVAEGQWYTEAVRWAAANGLLVNVAAGATFEPNSTITREQFASVIYKYQKLIGGGYKNGWTHPLNFSDLNLMSAWALEPLTWCNEFGILNGVGYDRIDPQGTVTRAQLAQILLNLSKLAVNEK